jgi:hypothetical protein
VKLQAQLIDGKLISEMLRKEIAAETKALIAEKNITPGKRLHPQLYS